MKIFSVLLAILMCVATNPACGNSDKPMPPALAFENIGGYLPVEAIPDSMALLPPPPAPGSPSLATDDAASRENLTLRGTQRWELAQRDAVRSFPEAAEAFTCAVNAPITEQDTPHLYLLLRKTLADASNPPVGPRIITAVPVLSL